MENPSPLTKRTVAWLLIVLVCLAAVAYEQNRPSSTPSEPLGVALVAWLLSGEDDGVPIVNRSEAYPGPDGAYVATLEVVDNGLGFGQGALYDEVHITRRGEAVGAHGDPGRSVVFYAEVTDQKANEVSVSWVGPRRLRVTYGLAQHPGRTVRAKDGVAVELEQQPAK